MITAFPYLSIYVSLFLQIYLSIYLCKFPHINQSIYIFMLVSCISIYLSISVFSSIYLSFSISISVFHLSIYLSISVCSYLSIYLSISVCSYLSIYLSLFIYLSIYVSLFCRSIYLSIYLCKSFYLSIYLSQFIPYLSILYRGDFSTRKGDPLKLVDKFTYLGSSVSSTEDDINTRLAKAWTAIIGYRSYGSQT